MIKSASLGDEKEEIQRQNSLSQIIHQQAAYNNNNQNMNGSKTSNNQAKINTHSRVGSRNLLLDNDSSKDTLHLQPVSLIPTASQSQYISSKHFEGEEMQQIIQQNNIGAREGAEVRSRLFLENKDIFLPKQDFSQDDIPAFNEGDNSLRQKLTPKRNSLVEGNSPIRYNNNNNKEFQNDIKTRQHHINSLSVTKPGSALAANTAVTRHQKESTNNLVPSINHISNNNNNLFSNMSHTSNLINNVGSTFGVPASSKKIQSQLASAQKIPAPSQTFIPFTGNILKSFMYINHFAWAMKKILIFLRPKTLNKLQIDCINDKGACDYNDFCDKDNIRQSKELKHATRLWITKRTICYHFVRDLKKKFKFVYIVFYKMGLKLQNFQNTIDKKLPYFNPISLIWRLWDFFILLITLLNFVFIPLDYSFGIGTDLPIKLICAIIFFLDIFKLFNTAFFDKGILITSKQVIFLKYLKSTFIFDLITALSLIVEPFQYTSLIFFIRYFYIDSLSEKVREVLTNYQQINGLSNLAILFLTIIYHCHLISCIWFQIGKDQQSNGDQGWLSRYNLIGQSKDVQYLNSYYFSVITLTNAKGDILPSTSREKIFLVFCSLYACGLIAYIINNSSKIFNQINKKKTKLLNQLSSLNQYLDQHEVSPSLRIQAQKYIEYVNNEGMQQKQDSIQSLNYLSKYLQEEIVKDVFIKQFKKIPVLNKHFGNTSLLEKLSTKVKEQVFGPGELIVRSNRPIMPCLYFIVQGEVEVYVQIGSQQTNKSQINVFKVLKKNEYFGQVEFFSQDYTTSLSVKAKGFTQIQYITLYDFLEIIQSFPDEKEAFCYLKDCVTLNNQYETIGISCFSCQSSNHVVMKCPYLFYHQSKDRIIKKLEQSIQYQIKSFRRCIKRKKEQTLGIKKIVEDKAYLFSQNYEDLINTSVYEEYQDEVDSDQKSYFKQQTCPQFEKEERSTYTRKTSKKQSLKQTSTVEELPNYIRKNSQKKTSLKMLNPNSLEEIHEKSQISRISQFSNTKNMRGESLISDEKKYMQQTAQGSVIDQDQSIIQNRKRTHSNLSQILGSRKSPFPSERDMNRSYSGSLISSLKLSEADKKIIVIEERNGIDGSKIQQIPGAPNLFVIKVNEGDEYSLINHRAYSNMNNVTSLNTFDPSEYQNRRHNSNFSLASRGIVQSSNLTSMNQPIDEFSELRLDQTNRIRENSFIPNQQMDVDNIQGFYLTNEENTTFEEQQNFKLYFAHNNLQNVINQSNKKSVSPSKNNLNTNQNNRTKPKKSSYLRVVSVNNKNSNKVLSNQLEVNPALLPYNINTEKEQLNV
ncbi:cyclic nucleotide-binding domain protein (macronuclear) [Tetrahymena thermophila SB210]|uniref:Cyclic nucleotide-binding domain protein n=1 Tax=Tetrahymena thermophila (strain SB210) TaxID=312017 RepID=Q233A5_TETTS|nr:cyclic nucleotide-binding domain protein [Tetrahymena thermophila SB210]EAR91675.2 cyclic nucleotide-binding domain protein [Tetrahymena thermophila SB210]|eukprot:XP_001011920.2 cyclic nucleotide-binding domain protein [Tetrahymena thermophila SB210]